MTAAAQCQGISALTLGFPRTCALPESKGSLPKQAFYARVPVSAKLKQHFVTDVSSITMLALLRPDTIGVADGARVHEILAMGIHLNSKEVPLAVLDHIARLRSKSKLLFLCVHDRPEATGEEECCLAVQYTPQQQAGHMASGATQPTHSCSPWRSTDRAHCELRGTTMDEVWSSLCAQVMLSSSDGNNLDARIARQQEIERLTAEIAKLEGDHQRAKNQNTRNEIYAKLHKDRTQLDKLTAQA